MNLTNSIPEASPLIIHLDKIKRLSIATPSFNLVHQCLRRTLHESGMTSTPACKLIVGHSRSGKSFAVREFEALYPATRTPTGLVKEVVYVQAPTQGTIKGLMQALLEALGDPHWERGTNSTLLARLKKLLRGVGCKMIIIDEFQHLADKGQQAKLKHTTDWLKGLVEVASFSIVCVGLPESKRIIQPTEQLRTRFDAAIEMPVYDWTNDYSRKSFRSVVACIQKSMLPFQVPDLGSAPFSLRLFLACGGRIGLLSKIFDRAIKNAIWDNRTIISLENLDDAFREAIWFANEIPIVGGPFLGELNPISTQILCDKVMTLAEHVPLEEADNETHMGTLNRSKDKQKENDKPKSRTKKALRAEMARALA